MQAPILGDRLYGELQTSAPPAAACPPAAAAAAGMGRRTCFWWRPCLPNSGGPGWSLTPARSWRVHRQVVNIETEYDSKLDSRAGSQLPLSGRGTSDTAGRTAARRGTGASSGASSGAGRAERTITPDAGAAGALCRHDHPWRCGLLVCGKCAAHGGDGGAAAGGVGGRAGPGRGRSSTGAEVAGGGTAGGPGYRAGGTNAKLAEEQGKSAAYSRIVRANQLANNALLELDRSTPKRPCCWPSSRCACRARTRKRHWRESVQRLRSILGATGGMPLRTDTETPALAVSSDERWVAAGDVSGSIHIWDLAGCQHGPPVPAGARGPSVCAGFWRAAICTLVQRRHRRHAPARGLGTSLLMCLRPPPAQEQRQCAVQSSPATPARFPVSDSLPCTHWHWRRTAAVWRQRARTAG